MTFLCTWRKTPRTIMLPNNIKLMSKEIAPTFSTDTVAKIKKYCKTQTKDISDHLSKSLSPNIHGHEYIKKAILCMLLWGNEKVLNNGARIKGDINILLLVAQTCAFGDAGKACQSPLPGITKDVDLICSQFSPVKLKLSITPYDIYMEAVFLNNV